MAPYVKVDWITVATIICIISTVHAFLDTKSPIVISYRGKDSFFGYSLAFNRGRWGNFLTYGGTLFIGAPNETRYTKNTGVVWQCRFTPESDQLSCSLLSSLSEQEPPKLTCHNYERYGQPYPEQETDQRIGFTLGFWNRQLVVGAPRWKLNQWQVTGTNRCSNESHLIGAVYRFSPENTITPVRNPFYENSRNREHNRYSSSTDFGFSTFHTYNDALLVGAPSHGGGYGAMVHFPSSQIAKLPQSAYKANTFLERPFEDSPGFGYTLASGSTTLGIYYAVAAPRGKLQNMLGTVAILHPITFVVLASYEGEQLGSYFGYALATADLNGDGYDELIVGSPGLTPESLSLDPRDSYKSAFGCVFVFDGREITWSVLPFKICISKPETYSISNWTLARFGSAICKLGDINADNYEDFAVSAPYTDGGAGTVFIFHGEPWNGGKSVSQIPAHVIHGKLLGIPNLHGLGTFLLGSTWNMGRANESTGLLDVDGNGTPDLVMGASESNHVIVLRTRPIAKAEISVTFHTTGSQGDSNRIYQLLPTQKDFRMRVCVNFRYSVKLPNTGDTLLDTWISLEADPLYKRVGFQGKLQKIEFKQKLSARNPDNCFDNLVFAIDEEYSNADANLLEFRATLWYNETSLNQYQVAQPTTLEISNAQDHTQKNIYGDFQPYQPAPIPPTRSPLATLEIRADNCDTIGFRKVCDSELIFTNGPVLDGNGAMTVGQLKALTISMGIINRKQTAYQVTFRINWSASDNLEVQQNALTFAWREVSIGKRNDRCKLTRQINQQTEQRSWLNMVQCSKSLHTGTEIGIQLEIGGLSYMKMNGSDSKATLNFNVEVYPEQDEQTKKITKSLQVTLKNDVRLGIKTVKRDNTKIDKKGKSLVDLNQVYRIENTGVTGTSANAVIAQVLLPMDILIADPSTGSTQCFPKGFQFFQVSSQNTLEENGTITYSTKSATINTGKVTISGKYITFPECSEEKKQTCQKIICQVDMPADASREIHIQMYIQRKHIEKLITEETEGVRVYSSGSLYFSQKFIQKVQGISQSEFRTIPGIPAWYFLASGAGGVILLVLVTVALFKCGFFKRKTKEKLKDLKRRTMMHLDQVDMDTLRSLNTPEGNAQEDEN